MAATRPHPRPVPRVHGRLRHARRRVGLGAAAALSVAALVAGLTALQAQATTARTTVTAPASTPNVTFRPTVIPKSAPEIPNTLRGQYEWLGAASQVPGWPMDDVYYRDQVAWSRIEKTKGTYDFTWFDNGVAEAQRLGGRFGFRVMAYCPWCWLDATPDWMPLQAGTDVPDWNSETFLSSWESLMSALGARYGSDPRLGWVDIGGYGDYGEWHSASGAAEISDANAQRVVQAVVGAFPGKHVIMNAMTPRFTTMALGLTPRMGLRTDCLGEYNMFSLIPTSPVLQQVWKTAPVLSEWCGTLTTDFALGAQQVKQYHVSQTSSANFKTSYAAMTSGQKASFVDAMKSSGYRYEVRSLTMPSTLHPYSKFVVGIQLANVGSAPTYDQWHVMLQLRDATGAVAFRADTGINLQSLLSGTRTDIRVLRLPRLAPGTYTVALVVKDASGYLAPMNLAVTGRTKDGAYPLGRVTVTR